MNTCFTNHPGIKINMTMRKEIEPNHSLGSTRKYGVRRTVTALCSWFLIPLLASLHANASETPRYQDTSLGFSEREVFESGAGFDWSALQASFGALSLFATQRLLDLRLPTGKPGKEGGALEGTPADDMRFAYIKYDS